jgi:hypothetical protein
MPPGPARAAASLPVVTNASRAKRKRAAVRSAKRSRNNTWWYGLTAIVIIAGIALIVYTQATKPADVGPFLADQSNPTKKDTHWHAALGVYDCDHWMGDTPGTGIWNWPAATPSGTPARADNTNVYAGMHSHDDGIIHMEPLVSAEAGRSATVGLYFQYGGWKLSDTGYSFLGTTVKNGDKCGGKAATLQWEVGKWDGDTTGKTKQKYTVESGNPAKYKLFDGDLVVIAFLPQGKSLASIGDPPSVKNLANALNVETAPAAAGTATTLPAVTAPGVTTPTTAPTATTPATTPTTKKP